MGIRGFWARNFFMMMKQNGRAFLYLCRNLTSSKKGIKWAGTISKIEEKLPSYKCSQVSLLIETHKLAPPPQDCGILVAFR